MEGGLKRLGALFLKSWAVLMVPGGVGLMLYGLVAMINTVGRIGDNAIIPFSVGVTLAILAISEKIDRMEVDRDTERSQLG